MMGYRKMFIGALGIGSADAALYLGKIDGPTWATLVGGMVASYLAINSLVKSKI